jgi:transaldolase
MNPLLQLLDQGQAVWLDSIQRDQLLSSELKQLIEEDGLRGETANPTIFEHALNGPDGAYDEQLVN